MSYRYHLIVVLSLFLTCSTVTAKEKQTQALSARAALQFIPNEGQVTDQYGTVRSDIDTKADGGTVVMFVGSGELHYQFYKKNNPISSFPKGEGEDALYYSKEKGSNENSSPPAQEVSTYRLDVELVGANKNAEVVFREPTGYTEHYYTGTTPEEGVHLSGYRKVIYKNIWPGIDWVVYTQTSNSQHPSSNIKYDFIIHPGGNPADIHLRYKGATELKLDAGALVAVTPYGTITEAAPYSYLQESGEKINSSYILEGNELHLATGNYSGTLVIDPYLRWGTYFGGSSQEKDSDIATGPDGSVYLYGETQSTNNIATTGAHKVSLTTSANNVDGYIAKFSDSCKLLWATYYGGDTTEYATGIATDKWGNIYICGSTQSDHGIATNGAFQSVHAGTKFTPPGGELERAGFLAKFTPTGKRLWGTYIYGKDSTESRMYDVACDGNGDVYTCGYASDPYNLSTQGAFMDTGTGKYNTSRSNIIFKFNPAGQRLWSTYFSSENGPRLGSIACDGQNNIYVAGDVVPTIAVGRLTTNGAHQNTLSGVIDGILAKFNSGGSLLWCTYYGGSKYDFIGDIACDKDDNVYIVGTAGSSNNIATAGTHLSNSNGGSFIAKFNSSGTRLWGTYFDPSLNTMVRGIVCSPGGRIYITGRTQATSGVATNNAYKTSYQGGQDAFLAEFSPTGQLLYGTYYGGAGFDIAGHLSNSLERKGGIALSPEGVVYIAGETQSTSGIATAGANIHQTSYAGSRDAFIAAFYLDTTVYIKQPYTDTVWCPGDTVRIVYGVNLPFVSGNTFTVQLSNATGSFASPVAIGTITATAKDTIDCVIPLNTTAGTGYRIRISADKPARVSEDNIFDIRIKANPDNFSAASNTPVCTGDTLKLEGATSSTGITWSWTGPGSFSSAAEDTAIAEAAMSDAGDYILKSTLNSTGCSLYDTATVVMKLTPVKPVIVTNSPVCEELDLQLAISSTTGGVGYTWSGPASFSSSSANPSISNMQSVNAGDYIGTVTLNGCSSSDTATVVVNPKPAMASASAPNSPLCARQDLQLNATTVNGANYNWYGPGGYTASSQNPSRVYMQYNDSGYYYVYTELNTCLSDTDSVKVVVNTDPFVNIFPTPGANICDGAEAIFTAVPTNGGTPTYEWFINGISTGQTGLTYKTSNIQQGDIVTCHMTSTGTCATPFTDTSNDIPMSVTPLLTPAVSITSTPNTTLYPNEPVSFTATPTNGGPTPQYQWRRNGQDIGGATGATWGANANFMSDGDEICVLMTSDYACPDPDTALSNCIKVDIRVSVEDISKNSGVKVYPNPTQNVLIVENTSPDLSPANMREEVTVRLFDILGREVNVSTSLMQNDKIMLDMSGVAAGNYVLKVLTAEGALYFKVVKE